MTGRVDVHQHVIPPRYRTLLQASGIAEAGGRPVPDWSADDALATMGTLGTATAILSVSTPGVTFLADDPERAADAARDVNTECAAVRDLDPDRFGFFATLPTPDPVASLAEARHALEVLGADGLVMLTNSAGVYLGEDPEAWAELFAYLDEREAVVLVHPADLPADPAPDVPPFAADFLLDTTRAAYLLVRNGIRRDFPRIRWILSHAGGMVPYVSHRLAVTIMDDTGRNLVDVLDELASFWFDTALSSSPAALPTLLAFAKPGHVLFGSDWPFAPEAAGAYFAAGLDTYGLTPAELAAIDRDNALALFPRLGSATDTAAPLPWPARARAAIRRAVVRRVVAAIGRR